MRQGQQNRRGRGRGNGQGHQGRKNQNPLTRSFESNGPDVKIRGTPAHIAEKYSALARDAQSSGDPVLAENYLQHAEHYNRIIMTYREQQMSQNTGEIANGSAGAPSRQRMSEAPEAGAEADVEAATGEGAPQQAAGQEPQPRSSDGQQRFEDRPQRSSQRGRQDRGDRQERGEGGFRRGRERQQPPATHEQPEFLRRSVRRPRRDSTDDAGEVAATAASSSEDRE